MHIRDIRGLLPLAKLVGETEKALLTKVREEILRASGIKFRFVDGFHLTALGPPMDAEASGVVVAVVGFDKSVVTADHEQLPATYRATIALKEKSDPEPNLTDFVNEFSSKYCGRDLLLNSVFFTSSTRVPAPTLLEVQMQSADRPGQRVAYIGSKSRIEKMECEERKNGQVALEIDCWLNFALPSILKLMEEKMQSPLNLTEWRRTKLGPWSIDNCLSRELIDSKETPSMDAFMKAFRETRVMHRGVLHKCFDFWAWKEICDARVVTRHDI